MQANASLNMMHDTQGESEGKTLVDTLAYVKVEQLIATLADMLSEANAKTIGDTQ